MVGKTRIILGLNSGTSADGLDLIAMKFKSARGSRKHVVLSSKCLPYPEKLKHTILTMQQSSRIKPEELIALDNILGQFMGRAAQNLIKELNGDKIQVDAVASHGQTIRHLPEPILVAGKRAHGSLQIGSPEQIAVLTDLPVVSDFRQADIALGGEGAPITVGAMHSLFADRFESRLIVNIGGMSNYFFFPAGQPVENSIAADCGPGNSLLDLLARQRFDMPFDRNGILARKGTVNLTMLKKLQRSPFFAGRTKSTGKEEFGNAMIKRLLAPGKDSSITDYDCMATAAELTVWSIVRQVKSLLTKEGKGIKLYLTGGGAHNTFIRNRLTRLLPQIMIGSIDQLGFSPALVEAASYAVMGDATLRRESMPTRFGRGRDRKRKTAIPVSGRISLPPAGIRD